ncbi:MAG: hypothetical protein J6T78_04020 [Bacteroidaceae bacterium]|nr:hypothetical protein [Bacteroidaceae bacterium]
MARNVEILNNVEYATALKEAIILRQKGTIPRDIDDMLGVFANSITHWVIVDAVKNGRLWLEHSNDEDFQCNVRLGILKQLDKVDTNRQPKEIIKYLFRVGTSAIRDQLLYLNRDKRKHEEIEIESAIVTTDIYGNRQGLGFEATTTM